MEEIVFTFFTGITIIASDCWKPEKKNGVDKLSYHEKAVEMNKVLSSAQPMKPLDFLGAMITEWLCIFDTVFSHIDGQNITKFANLQHACSFMKKVTHLKR